MGIFCKPVTFFAYCLLAAYCGAAGFAVNFSDKLDPGYWTEFQIGSSDDITVECPDEWGRLRILKESHEYDGKSRKGGIISRFILDGNLSFFVDFDILSLPLTEVESSFNEACIALVSVETGETIYWVRATADESVLLGYSSVLNLGFGANEDWTLTGQAGISRVGNRIDLYIDRGEGSVVFASLENSAFAGPMYVQMHIKQAGSPPPTTELDIRYDNCLIEADSLLCPPKITSPTDGDNIVANRDILITWDNPAIITPGDYHLEYSTDGGKTFVLIDTVDVLEGRYMWHTPTLNRNHCVVRLISAVNENVRDQTGEFIIFRCYHSIPGDVNMDCYVNLLDLAILASNWTACGNRFFAECEY